MSRTVRKQEKRTFINVRRNGNRAKGSRWTFEVGAELSKREGRS